MGMHPLQPRPLRSDTKHLKNSAGGLGIIGISVIKDKLLFTKMVVIYGLVLLSSTCSGIDNDQLYSFGRDFGDEVLSSLDNGSSDAIHLSTPFILFGQSKSTVYVSAIFLKSGNA